MKHVAKGAALWLAMQGLGGPFVSALPVLCRWFGEGERLVRALFGLAHKLAPR